MVWKRILIAPSIENSYLQTGKKQTMNRDATMVMKLTCEWGTTEAQFQVQMQNANCANYNFLKCLHSGRPLDGPYILKCLPRRPHNLKCFLNRCVTINFPPIVLIQYCLQWIWTILFFKSIPGWLIDACSLVRWMLLIIVWINFAELRSYKSSWAF